MARTKFSAISSPVVDEKNDEAMMLSLTRGAIHQVMQSERETIFLSIHPNTLNNGYEN